MSQASTWNVPTSGPGTMAAFAARASATLDAVLTWHSGSSRPAYAVAGTVWQKNASATAVEFYFWDGSTDILIGTVNPIANTFTLNTSGLGFATSAVARTDVAPLSLVNGRIVASAGASGEGLIELKGKTTTPFDASGLKWTNGNTGAQFFDLISNAGTGLKLRDSAAADVLQFLATGDVTSKLWGALSEQIVPPGTIIVGPWTSAPAGYVKANGALLSRTTYPRAWAAALAAGKLVSEATWSAGAYGAFSTGDGSTTFRIPDLNGYFVRGVRDETAWTIGGYVADRFANHLHSGTTDNGGVDHTHQYNSAVSSPYGHGSGGVGGTAAWGGIINTGSASAYIHVHQFVTGLSGTGSETFPRNIALLACIKI